jgi:hypothetical protein
VSVPIRYARSGDVNIAYEVTGDGPFDLVYASGFSPTSRSTASTGGMHGSSGGSRRSLA